MCEALHPRNHRSGLISNLSICSLVPLRSFAAASHRPADPFQFLLLLIIRLSKWPLYPFPAPSVLLPPPSPPILPTAHIPLLSFPSPGDHSIPHLHFWHTSVTKLQAQFGEVTAKESSNSTAKPTSSKSAPAVAPDADSINAFIAQVSDLVKLVDSRDIVELELKQPDCELLIRKKEALPLPPAPVSPPQSSYYAAPPSPQALAPAAAAPPSSATRALPAPATAKASASSHPPLKCPMAGTFYRCPGPGEPPFVKVGDKVQKGQVICIIEAMKLMNEIEADQTGTVAEILVEDGKPVSVDNWTCLFLSLLLKAPSMEMNI